MMRMSPMNRAITFFATLSGVALVALGAVAAPEATMSDLTKECVGSEAPKTLEACPGGPSKFEGKQKHGAAFKSAPPPTEVKKRQDDSKPINPEELKKYAERDTRKTRLQARARALLITEIQGLERLYKSTPENSPDKPQLTRRLAEGYVELESAAVRDKIAADIQAQDAKAKKQDPSKFRTDSAAAEKILKAARLKAIAYYTAMKDKYPKYSKIDEVLYYLAYEYEQSQNYDKAREVYLELIDKAPKSPYIPNAYLAFGELFFQEAQGDPSKWELAAAAYKEVIKYPPPNNKVYGYARYKLGYVHWNKGDYANALSEFKKVIEYGDGFSDLPNAKQLAKSARRDLIPVYAVSGAPDKAYNFLKPISGDKGGETKLTIDMMNELGLAYIDTGHYKEAIVLYKDLLSRDGGEKSCFYQGQITAATQALFSGDKEAVRKELDNQLRVRNDFAKGGTSEKSKFDCSNKTAELLAETAMSWHLEAVGSGGVRGTGDKKTMDLAAYLYKKVSENFSADDFSKFQFPRIVKDDWPTMYKIKYAMADLLYFQQRWEDCGPAFDAVVAENPKAEQAAEAAYASVLCYQKMYDQMYKGDADRKGRDELALKGAGEKERAAKKGQWDTFKPKDLTTQQKGMVQAFNRYICYIKPTKGDKESEEQYVEVKYARARTYFEAQHWEEAAIAFREVAINHSDKDAGIFAAQLYLEAINVLGSRAEPPRPSCFDDMGKDVPTFLELYCKGQKFEDNKEQCEALTRIQFDIARLKAQKIVEVADGQQEKGQYRESLDNYKKGADAYLELWRTYCEEPLAKGEHPKQCEKADEIVYNMARAYQAARLLAKSIQVRQILLSDKYGLDKSDLAKKATYEIGGNYQAIAVYDRAADYFERYAKVTDYKGETADQALSDAVVLRLGLGQEDQAIADAAAFNKYYGARKAAQAAQIAFAVAAHYGEKKDWGNVQKRLSGTMKLIDSKATLDVQVQAHALLARALVQTKREGPAGAEYGKIVKTWADPKAAVAQIMNSEDDANAKQRRLGRALEAVGEATFFFAELKKEKVDKVDFPAYKGPGNKEAVLKHIQTKVKEWIQKKRPLIDDASLEYKKIVDLQPVPPPRWVIAAGSRVGEMWGTFVKEFRAAPIPDGIKKDYELRTAYFGALDDASEPQKLQAKGAFEVCLGYSVKYQYFDQFSRTCEEWLATNYKNEYHLVDEFRGNPNRVNSVLKEQGNPLRIGGTPIAAQTAAEPPPEKKKVADANDGKDKDKKSADDSKSDDKKDSGKKDSGKKKGKK